MLSQTKTEYKLSLNKIVISGFVILVIGAVVGSYLPMIQGLHSDASLPRCANELQAFQSNFDTLERIPKAQTADNLEYLMELWQDYRSCMRAGSGQVAMQTP